MGKQRNVFLPILLLLSLSVQIILAQTDEYEYYYEELSTTPPSSVAEVVDTSTMTIFQEPSSMIPPTDVPIVVQPIFTSSSENVDDETPLEKEDTMLNITKIPISLTNSGTLRPPTIHGTAAINYSGKPHIKRTGQKTSFQMPEIVLNVYYGMYGMQNIGNKRGGSSSRERNKSWSYNQNPLQGWYGLDETGSNRRYSQSWNSYPRKPAYRGRGQMNEYDNSKRNSKQKGREETLDQNDILRLFLSLLGQSSSRSSTKASRSRM